MRHAHPGKWEKTAFQRNKERVAAVVAKRPTATRHWPIGKCRPEFEFDPRSRSTWANGLNPQPAKRFVETWEPLDSEALAELAKAPAGVVVPRLRPIWHPEEPSETEIMKQYILSPMLRMPSDKERGFDFLEERRLIDLYYDGDFNRLINRQADKWGLGLAIPYTMLEPFEHISYPTIAHALAAWQIPLEVWLMRIEERDFEFDPLLTKRGQRRHLEQHGEFCNNPESILLGPLPTGHIDCNVYFGPRAPVFGCEHDFAGLKMLPKEKLNAAWQEVFNDPGDSKEYSSRIAEWVIPWQATGLFDTMPVPREWIEPFTADKGTVADPDNRKHNLARDGIKYWRAEGAADNIWLSPFDHHETQSLWFYPKFLVDGIPFFDEDELARYYHTSWLVLNNTWKVDADKLANWKVGMKPIELDGFVMAELRPQLHDKRGHSAKEPVRISGKLKGEFGDPRVQDPKRIAKALCVRPETIAKRLKDKWPMSLAYTWPSMDQEIIEVTNDNDAYLLEYCRRAGVPYNKVRLMCWFQGYNIYAAIGKMRDRKEAVVGTRMNKNRYDSLAEACEDHGTDKKTYERRIQAGWEKEEAIIGIRYTKRKPAKVATADRAKAKAKGFVIARFRDTDAEVQSGWRSLEQFIYNEPGNQRFKADLWQVYKTIKQEFGDKLEKSNYCIDVQEIAEVLNDKYGLEDPIVAEEKIEKAGYRKICYMLELNWPKERMRTLLDVQEVWDEQCPGDEWPIPEEVAKMFAEWTPFDQERERELRPKVISLRNGT